MADAGNIPDKVVDDEGRNAGNDPAMAQDDRKGYSVEVKLMTGGVFKGMEENTSTEIGEEQDLMTTGPFPKLDD